MNSKSLSVDIFQLSKQKEDKKYIGLFKTVNDLNKFIKLVNQSHSYGCPMSDTGYGILSKFAKYGDVFWNDDNLEWVEERIINSEQKITQYIFEETSSQLLQMYKKNDYHTFKKYWDEMIGDELFA